MNVIKKNINLLEMLVFVVLFCTYIFPQNLIANNSSLSKLIFLIYIVFTYIFCLKKFKFSVLIFSILVLILTIITGNYNYLTFISLPLLDILLNDENNKVICKYLKKSNILYVCFFFTIIYSIIYFGYDGRYAFTSIKEINQSGLAIFLLAVLMEKKNEKLSKFIFLFGFFTFSRNYIIAVIIFFLYKLKVVRKLLNKQKIIDFMNYKNITIISSIILVLLGTFYIQQYKLGNIHSATTLSNKFFNLLDYSNYFRFTSIIKLLLIFKDYPLEILFGMTDYEYLYYGDIIASRLGIVSSFIVPHNLFFSHLKIYGIISIIETLFVSKILVKIVNNKNFLIYMAIVFYSVILGAGLYSYWLYLTVFALLLKED